ncbi:glutaredoxin 3 protein [Dioscorea alata]|uniref:Glutaredoxin 3 protein n=1 Tax=Dioscorea alata TaxID=55571 RepID=A0ACB7W3F8_DIOAL|nr:glutaredoxin 3 protein [Dioscorea alata]
MQGIRVRPLMNGGEGAKRGLTIDGGEAPEKRIERLIRENPVVIFSRRACCMCHVMRRLLATVGVHPTVIELEDAEAAAIVPPGSPAVFIGGDPVGGLEGLMALHLSGRLVPRLLEVGALAG